MKCAINTYRYTILSFISERCDLPRDPGPCSVYTSLWYYNSAEQRCQQFSYGGCEGNHNRFTTQLECSETCSDGHVEDETIPRHEGMWRWAANMCKTSVM